MISHKKEMQMTYFFIIRSIGHAKFNLERQIIPLKYCKSQSKQQVSIISSSYSNAWIRSLRNLWALQLVEEGAICSWWLNFDSNVGFSSFVQSCHVVLRTRTLLDDKVQKNFTSQGLVEFCLLYRKSVITLSLCHVLGPKAYYRLG